MNIKYRYTLCPNCVFKGINLETVSAINSAILITNVP